MKTPQIGNQHRKCAAHSNASSLFHVSYVTGTNIIAIVLEQNLIGQIKRKICIRGEQQEQVLVMTLLQLCREENQVSSACATKTLNQGDH